jgi:hypothetical protein
MVEQKNRQQLKKRNYKWERARTLLTNDGNDYELEKSINLSIEEESDATNENESDKNNIEGKFQRTCRYLLN